MRDRRFCRNSPFFAKAVRTRYVILRSRVHMVVFPQGIIRSYRAQAAQQYFAKQSPFFSFSAIKQKGFQSTSFSLARGSLRVWVLSLLFSVDVDEALQRYC